MVAARSITEINAPVACENAAWEAAYARFETRSQEIAKFHRRLRRIGADSWPRQATIVELFCGRGSGLVAWSQLGFQQLEGVDLSRSLLDQYEGPAKLYVCDCRKLPFEDNSRDVVIVQGGLHHLPEIPGDLARCLIESRRVLKPGGHFVAIEPWRTPFLDFVHWTCFQPAARRLFRKLDALATMTEQEHVTYFNWLSRAPEILSAFDSVFDAKMAQTRWGKLTYVGRKPW